MRARRRLMILVPAVAVSLTACGAGQAAAPDPGVAAAPAALRHARVTTCKYTVDVALAIDMSAAHNLSLRARRFYESLQGTVMTVAGDQGGPGRERMVVSYPQETGTSVTTVVVDGSGFASSDGTRFRTLKDTTEATGGLDLTPDAIASYAQKAGGASGEGYDRDGTALVEKVQKTLPGSDVEDTVKGFQRRIGAGSKLTSDGASPGAATLASDRAALDSAMPAADPTPTPPGDVDVAPFIRTGDATFDLSLLPTSPRLVAVQETFHMVLDLGGLAKAMAPGLGIPSDDLPSGTMDVTTTVTLHVTDDGSPVTVSPPPLDPNAPALPTDPLTT